MLLSMNGLWMHVQVTAPHGATEYVKAAMEFGNWVFKSDEEKDELRAAKRAIEATVDANHRMALLCEYTNTDKVPEAITGVSDHGGSGRGSPADLTAFNTELAAANTHTIPAGIDSSASGLSTAQALGPGAVDPTASAQRLDFAAAGRFGMARDATVSRSSVLQTPALKRQMQSHQALHTSVRSSMPAPIDPDPPTVLPTANFGARDSGVRASRGGLHGYGGDMDASLSFRQSGGKAYDQGAITSAAHASGVQHPFSQDTAGFGTGAGVNRLGDEALGMGPAAGVPPDMGSTRLDPAVTSNGSDFVPSSAHRRDSPGIHPLPGAAGRAATLGGVGGVGQLHNRHVPSKAPTAVTGAVPVYAGRLEELEDEFSSIKGVHPPVKVCIWVPLGCAAYFAALLMK